MTVITEHSFSSVRHTSFYLAAGPESGPLLIFVHGWPELAISWRGQIPVFANLGFRVIAPDMRGYGRSSNYSHHFDYRQELIVEDMMELLHSLGRTEAIWVGHDWGSPVVWNIASHHPEACQGVASLCVPYRTLDVGLDHLIGLVDRSVYPEADYPAGQWEYMRFYEENFIQATQPMDANPKNMIQAMFRKGSPDGAGKPSGTAMVRKNGGWFGPEGAPDVPRDVDVVSEEDLSAYASALERNGFYGPNSWYMNHEANAGYYEKVVNDGYLDMPVLFIAAEYDYTCEAINSDMAVPMREYVKDLTEATVPSGHWMAQEQPVLVNAILVEWIVSRLPRSWPTKMTRQDRG